MRVFFLLLLLANIGYFTWQWMTPAEPMQPPSVVQQGERLLLLSELDDKQTPPLRGLESTETLPEEAQPETVPVDPSPSAAVTQDEDTDVELPGATMLCVTVSELKPDEQVARLIRRLRNEGAEGIEQGEQAGVRHNYWVLLPPHANRALAEHSADALRAERVADFFIVRTGQHENAVSLGVFSTRERAERRRDEITRLSLGIPRPQIELMELPTREAWLSYRIPRDRQEMLRDELTAVGSLQEVSCR